VTISGLQSRLIGWVLLVGAVSILGYAGRASGGKPDEDVLFKWSTAAGQLGLLAVILALTWAIAAGAPKRELFALRQPVIGWPRALLLAAGVFVAVQAIAIALNPVLHPGEEQGLTTGNWISGHTAAFAVNFLAFAVIGPTVEELLFRGAGYRLLEEYGARVAILVTGLLFGLWHGLIDALPILVAFGLGLAYLRFRTRSIYPCIVLHVFFNTIGIVVAMTT
jgi:membrane protease YdiL (CAAX protease family)